MEKKNFFQTILFGGILIILLLTSCNGFVSSPLEFDEGDDVALVSFDYDWDKSVCGDTAQLSCLQTLVYSAGGKEMSVSPLAYVKLWVKQDTVLSASEVSGRTVSQNVTSSSSSSGILPTKYKLRKSFELNDKQVVIAEIVYEDFNLISQETGQAMPHLEITDFTLDDILVARNESAKNNYRVSVSFNVPWAVINRGDKGTEQVDISYVRSSVDESGDQLLFTDYETGAEWIDKSSFKLFVNKIETWSLSGIKNDKIYSQTLPFSLNHNDKPSLMVDKLDFIYQVSLTQLEAEKISSDENWNIQKRTAMQVVRFDCSAQDFFHAFSYPLYEVSANIDNRVIDFNLSALFDVELITSQFGDTSKKITSSATVTFLGKSFEAATSTLLIRNSDADTDDDADNLKPDDNQKDENEQIGANNNPLALKYGRIIDFQVSAILDVDAFQNGGTITKKAVVIRFEEGYYFGTCDLKDDFPTQFIYTQSGYSGFNSVAQPQAGKPFRIARAVVYKDGIKWFAEDNSLITGIDVLSCAIYGWDNIVGGLYSPFINTYGHSYSADSYSLTLTAPSGQLLTIQSSAL